MNSNKFNKVITYSLRKNKIGLTSTAIIFSILGTAGTIQKEVKAVEAKQEINTSSSQHNEKGNSTLDSVKESNVENTTNKNNEKTLLAQKEITKEDSIQKDSEKQKTFSTTTETDIATIKRTYEQQNSPDTWKVKTEIIKKEIDHGADIVALLDTSSHMKENGRLEQAKKLLETLSSHILGGNNKNKLSLIVFNSDTKNIVDFTDDINKIKEHINSDSTSVKKHEEAFLQKAIHQASELLQKQDSQRSKHIVMLSYGKSNYSYDFKKSDKEVPTGSLQKVNTIHKLLGLFPYKVNHTRHNVGELQAIAKLFNINVGDIESLAKLGSLFLPNLDYVQLNETKPTENTDFDYDKRVGDGTDAHTYKGYKKNGEISTPVKNLIAKYLKEFSPFEKLNDFFKSSEYKKKNKDKKDFFDNLTTNFDPVQNIGGRLGNWLFKPHSLTFYNHNNSALAETNKAKAKGIKFHSIDVDNANTDYDKFLKDISSEKNFLTLTNQKETAKTFEKKLTTIELKDELPAGTTLTQGPTVNKGNAKFNNSNSSLWSLFSSSKPNVTWKFEKDDLVDNSPLSLEYTIKLKDDNKNKTLSSTFSYRLEDKSSTVKLPDQVFSLDKKEKDIPQTPKNEDDKDKNDKPKVEDNKGQDKNQKPEVEDNKDNNNQNDNNSETLDKDKNQKPNVEDSKDKDNNQNDNNSETLDKDKNQKPKAEDNKDNNNQNDNNSETLDKDKNQKPEVEDNKDKNDNQNDNNSETLDKDKNQKPNVEDNKDKNDNQNDNNSETLDKDKNQKPNIEDNKDKNDNQNDNNSETLDKDKNQKPEVEDNKDNNNNNNQNDNNSETLDKDKNQKPKAEDSKDQDTNQDNNLNLPNTKEFNKQSATKTLAKTGQNATNFGIIAALSLVVTVLLKRKKY